MRSLFTTILLILSLYSNGQKPVYKFKLKEHIAPAVCMALSGACDGLNQAISFHYDKVDAKLHLNDSWANPDISWRRKYKDGDPANGRAFPGSTTWLVWTTDLYHLSRTGSNVLNAGAISIKVVQGTKKRWYIYVFEIISYWTINRLGFYSVYSNF